jgi:hypothetical protein
MLGKLRDEPAGKRTQGYGRVGFVKPRIWNNQGRENQEYETSRPGNQEIMD